jgi:hypothetical protein
VRTRDLRIPRVVFLLGIGWAAAVGQKRDLAGQYICVSTGSGPCATGTELQLTENGNWRWGRYSGTFTSARGYITFDGIGGLAAWGPAAIGPATLTFTSRQQKVVWRKPSSGNGNAGLAPGAYYCTTAPGGCQTGKGIEIAADGTWSWGASGGSYSIVGGRAIFRGPQLPDWGPADIGDRKLVFHSRHGDSEWSASGAGSVKRAAVDPNTFELACPLRPFDRQRLMATIEDTLAPGASDLTKAAAHQQLADFCRRAGDAGRAEQESLKAQYWKNGGRR